MLGLLFAAAVVTAGQGLRAQTLQATLSHYSTENGLKSDAIAELIQDDYGYIWIGTWNGLSRFDGYHFYNYQTGNGSHIPHLHNRVADMLIDDRQNVWLHMYDGRVFVLDRKHDKIVNPFLDVANSEDYRASSRPFVSNAGDVYVPIDDVGLYKMRLNDGQVEAQLITTAGLKVTCMAEGYHNDIWLGTDKGVHRIDMGNASVERKALFEDEHVTALFSNGFNIYVGTSDGRIHLFAYGQEPMQLRQATGKKVLSIFVDSHGLVWFADPGFGANKLNTETGQERHYEQRVLVPEHDGTGGVFHETNGVVWIRMNHGGYGYYNRETDEVEYFHNDPVNPWNLSNTVNASLELDEGVIFESTSRRALEKLELLKNNITRTLLIPNAESTIENEIRAMYYDEERKLMLMGNKNSTLFITRSDGTQTTISSDSKGNPLGRVYGITKDSKGNYWLCSKDNGVFKMTPGAEGYHIVNFCHNDSDKWSLSSNNAYVAVEDKYGDIWVATYGGGINQLTRDKAGRYIFKHSGNTMRAYPHNAYNKVRTLTIDKEGNVWAGTTDGVLIFTPRGKGKEAAIRQLEQSEEQPDKILMSNDIVYMARDEQGDMWIGTHGGGLSHSVGKDSRGRWLFETFGSQDGLPSEEIKSITFDKMGNVWFATDHVLCSYNVQKRIFTTFSTLDGVDETMCSEGAALTMPNGNILFGTLNGYYTIDRKKLTTDNGAMIKLRITDFLLDDELQSPRLNSNYDYYVPDAKSVTLPGHNHVFTFRFASLNYQLQHRVHYQYMLEGYDHEWLNATKERTVSYANVPTGTYHFKVKAFLLDSPNEYDMREIEVIVPPYFLFSPRAIWLYMVVVVVLAVALMFWRQRHIEKAERLRVLRSGAEELDFSNPEDYRFVSQQTEWLESHYADHNLKIDDMVTHSGMSRTAFHSRMKDLMGQSPKEFVTDFRLKKAIERLEATDANISEIATLTGFSDPVEFARLFKAKMGMAPSKFRDEARGTATSPHQNGKQPADAPQQQPADEATKQEKTDEYEIIE